MTKYRADEAAPPKAEIASYATGVVGLAKTVDHLDDPGRARAHGSARPERDGRQSDVGRLPAQGAQPRLGVAVAEDSTEGVAPLAFDLRQMLPILKTRSVRADFSQEESRGSIAQQVT